MPVSFKTTHTPLPADGITALRKYGRKDVFSGLLVSLIALPLSLGIAQASGFPPMGGLITAIIGGILVGFLSGSPLTIKGPAAGLIAIAIGCVEAFSIPGSPLAGYKATLAVIAIAAVIQIVFGLIRAGRFGDFFPNAAVHGMLAAIGLIIISKQIHVLFGVKAAAKDPLMLFAELPHTLQHINPQIATIGLVSLGVLILMPMIKVPWVKLIPAPMVVLVVAIAFGNYFGLLREYTYLVSTPGVPNNTKFFVTLPSNLVEGFVFPDFSRVGTVIGLQYILMFALVGSLESLLTVKAVDILDPFKRKSNLNQDLLAVGVGNLICGLLGGLPMISEVVRSSANVNNGAISRWANIAHGVFLLIFLVFMADIIHQIPLAALAAMLVFTGWRLGGISHWRNAYAIGKDQFVIFAVTVLVTLATDLLMGIFAGVVVNLIWNLATGAKLKDIFKPQIVAEEEGEHIMISVKGSATFSNWIGLKTHLEQIPVNRHVIVDLSAVQLADHATLDNLERFKADRARIGSDVELRMGSLQSTSSHHMASKIATQ